MLDLTTIFKTNKKITIKDLEFTINYKDDKDANFITYGASSATGKAYFIELKLAKVKKRYNFDEFKPEQKNALFFVNFKCPPSSTLFLPEHMACLIVPQDENVNIVGNYEVYDLNPIQNKKRPVEQIKEELLDVKRIKYTEIGLKYANVKDFTKNFWSRQQKHDHNTFNEFFQQSYSFLLIQHPGNTIQYLLILITKNPSEFLSTEWQSFFKVLPNLITYYLLCVSNNLTFPNIKPSDHARCIATIHHKLGKLAINNHTEHLILPALACIPPLISQYNNFDITDIDFQGIANQIWTVGKLNERSEWRALLTSIPATTIANLIQKAEQQLLHQNLKAQNISITLWGLGRLVEFNETRFLLSQISPAVIAILITQLDKMPKSAVNGQNISNSLWALGKFAEYQEAHALLHNLNTESVLSLIRKIDVFAKSELEPQVISILFSTLGWFIEHTETRSLVEQISPQLIASLLNKLNQYDKKEIKAQNISIVIWMLGKFTSYPKTAVLITNLPAKSVESLCHHLDCFPKDEIEAQNIANAVWGLGKLVENPNTRHLVSDIKPERITSFVQKINCFSINSIISQNFGNTLLGLGKLVECEQTRALVEQVPDSVIAFLVNKLIQRLFNISDVQAVSNTLWSLAKFTEHKSTQHLATKVAAHDLALLVDIIGRFENKLNLNSINIALTFWSISILVENPVTKDLIAEISPESIGLLLKKLNAKLTPIDDLAISFWALGKFSKHDSRLLQCVSPELINQFLGTFQFKITTLNSKNISNIFQALGSFAENPDTKLLLNDIPTQLIVLLVNRLLESTGEVNLQAIANSLWGLAKLVDGPAQCHLLSVITPSMVNTLVTYFNEHLKNKSDQAIGLVIWALGKFCEHAETHVLLRDIESQIISNLMISVIASDYNNDLNIITGQVMWAIGNFVSWSETHFLLSHVSSRLINRLLNKACELKQLDDKSIGSILWAMGKIADSGVMRDLLTTVSPDTIYTLIANLCQLTTKNINHRTISNVLWAFGKFTQTANTASLVNKISARKISFLINSFLKLTTKKSMTSQNIGNAFWAIGKLSDYFDPLDLLNGLADDTISHMFNELESLDQILPQEIANSFWMLGRLANYDDLHYLLKKISATTITLLFNKLLQLIDVVKPQDITITLWAFGKLSQSFNLSHLLNRIRATTLAALYTKLAEFEITELTGQYIANAVWSLAKLNENPKIQALLNKISADHIALLLYKLGLSKFDDQEISSTLWALGKIAVNPKSCHLLSKVSSDIIANVVKKQYEFVDHTLITLTIANMLYGLGLLTNNDKTLALLDKVTPQMIMDLIEKMKNMPTNKIDDKHIANSLYGISTIVKNTKIFANVTNKKQDLSKLITKLFLKNKQKTFSLSAKNLRLNQPYKYSLILHIENYASVFSLLSTGAFTASPDSIKLMYQSINDLLRFHLGFKRFSQLISVTANMNKLVKIDATSLKILQDNIRKYIKKFPAQLQNRLELSLAELDIKNKPSSNVLIESHNVSPQKLFLDQTPTLKQIAAAPSFITAKKFTPNYQINKDIDIKVMQVATHNSFVYDSEFNKKRTKVKLFIAPVSVIGDELGVFAAEDIPATSTTIGCYAGDRSTKENLESKYLFELVAANGEIIEYIDAAKKRDWTSFINHSQIANVYVQQKTINNQTNIYFYIASPIKKGQQLLFNYGMNYFNNLGFKPYYVYPTDNWLTAEELYSQNAENYELGVSSFSQKICEDLQILSNWIVPKSFQAIFQNNITALNKYIQKPNCVDLFAYAMTSNNLKLASQNQQQHFTALMLACYLGHANCITSLIKAGADANRCMLVNGYLPLMILLKGLANPKTIEEIGLLLLATTKYYFMTDKQELTLLHYAIMKNSLAIVSRLIERAIEDQLDIFDVMLNREIDLPTHADFDYCIINGYFELLEIMLQQVMQNPIFFGGDFIENIKNGIIFREETFLVTKPENVSKFISLLQDKKFESILNTTDIMEMLQRVAPESVTKKLDHSAMFFSSTSVQRQQGNKTVIQNKTSTQNSFS